MIDGPPSQVCSAPLAGSETGRARPTSGGSFTRPASPLGRRQIGICCGPKSACPAPPSQRCLCQADFVVLLASEKRSARRIRSLLGVVREPGSAPGREGVARHWQGVLQRSSNKARDVPCRARCLSSPPFSSVSRSHPDAPRVQPHAACAGAPASAIVRCRPARCLPGKSPESPLAHEGRKPAGSHPRP